VSEHSRKGPLDEAFAAAGAACGYGKIRGRSRQFGAAMDAITEKRDGVISKSAMGFGPKELKAPNLPAPSAQSLSTPIGPRKRIHRVSFKTETRTDQPRRVQKGDP
jgi:hypothetical protein